MVLRTADIIVIATDISANALTTAQENAQKHKVDHMVKFFQGDLLCPLDGEGLEDKLAAIVSNPPYLSRRAMTAVSKEVTQEPEAALSAANRA